MESANNLVIPQNHCEKKFLSRKRENNKGKEGPRLLNKEKFQNNKSSHIKTYNNTHNISQKINLAIASENEDSDNEVDFSKLFSSQKANHSSEGNVNSSNSNIQSKDKRTSGNATSIGNKSVHKKEIDNLATKNNISNDIFQQYKINFSKNTPSCNLQEHFFPWMSEKTTTLRGMERLHQEILDFYEFIKPTSEEDILREQTINSFKEIIRKKWPNWTVKKFGSFPNRLHLPDSDVDVVIMTDSISTFENDQISILKQIHRELQGRQMVDYLRLIEARVPIIRTVLSETKIKMDICANRKNGYEAKLVVKRILEEYPYIRPLIYVLKYFLRQRRLNECYTGGVGSFLLFNLLFSYIQYLSKQPNQQSLSLSNILVGFFQFYGYEFNYEKLGISILKGGHYYPKLQKFPDSDRRSISVENFQETDQDIGKGSYKFKKVLECFRYARDNLYFPTEYPVISYLSMFIIVDDFLKDRYKKFKELNSKLTYNY